MKFGIFRLSSVDPAEICKNVHESAREGCLKRMSEMQAESRKYRRGNLIEKIGGAAIMGVVFAIAAMGVKRLVGWREKVSMEGMRGNVIFKDEPGYTEIVDV